MSNSSNRAAMAAIVSLGLGSAAAAQCIEGDINGDGVVNGIDLAYVLQNWNQSCPATVTSVSPSVGLPTGGTAITISGHQLGGVLSVTIGGVPATNVVGVDSTTITAVTPPSKTSGPKDVVVTTTSGAATLAGGFTYSVVADWAMILEYEPDPKVISDPQWRMRIIDTGLPWRVRDIGTGIEMLLVPNGTFMMGCSASDEYACNGDENPVHAVTLTQHFYMGRYEVTQGQWTEVMGSNPSYFQSPSALVPAEQVANRPVDQVSWHMIQSFENLTGLNLPTEAQWEYACRAGIQTAFNNGTNDDSQVGEIAWYNGNSDFQTHPVGKKLGNQLGLHDMSGNVWEWVNDWYDYSYYEESPSVDPTGPSTGMEHGFRGGCWHYFPDYCRASDRYSGPPDLQIYYFGFRVMRLP